MTPRTAGVLWAVAQLHADFAYDDVHQYGDGPVTEADGGSMAFADYPRITWGQDAVWRRQAARVFDDLAADLGAGDLPSPTCPGEEMALHLMVRSAQGAAADGWGIPPEVLALFARVKPEHKMRVVSAFKDLGEIVAVTGDGANDAPALRRADIGVAMGASGTDVAREAAVMVLLDDSFASIAAAVERGRSVYENIRTFLIYVFTSNVGELVPILVATFAGFPLVPLSAVQVLAIDLGSDVLPALALGTLQPEPGTMDRPPRSPRESLFSGAVVRRILFLGGIQAAGVTAVFFWHIHSAGLAFSAFTAGNPVYREALTMAQAGIVISQIFVGLTVRSDRASIVTLGLRSSGRMLAAQSLSLVAILAITYLPPLQRLFHTAPLGAADWAILVACGALLLGADEIRKLLLRSRTVRD